MIDRTIITAKAEQIRRYVYRKYKNVNGVDLLFDDREEQLKIYILCKGNITTVYYDYKTLLTLEIPEDE